MNHQHILLKDFEYRDLFKKYSSLELIVSQWTKIPSEKDKAAYQKIYQQISSIKETSDPIGLFETVRSQFEKACYKTTIQKIPGKSFAAINALEEKTNENLVVLDLCVSQFSRPKLFEVRKTVIASLEDWHKATQKKNKEDLFRLKIQLTRREYELKKEIPMLSHKKPHLTLVPNLEE